MDLTNISVTTNSSKLPVILLRIPAYLLQQIVITDFHLTVRTLLFQVSKTIFYYMEFNSRSVMTLFSYCIVLMSFIVVFLVQLVTIL